MYYQCNIYQYLEQDQDPLYQALKHLSKGQTVQTDEFAITYNQFGLYEVTTPETEIPFSSCGECYKFISRRISCFPLYSER